MTEPVLAAPSFFPEGSAGVGTPEAPRPVAPSQGRRNPASMGVSTSALALVAGVLLAAPQAGAHDITMDSTPSNDWIEGLRNSAGKSCCGNNDCRPVVAGKLVSRAGGLEVGIEGNRFPVPEGSVVPDISPDGRAWVCPDLRPSGGFMYSIQGVRCVLLPPSA
jgi:hypothetical protein